MYKLFIKKITIFGQVKRHFTSNGFKISTGHSNHSKLCALIRNPSQFLQNYRNVPGAFESESNFAIEFVSI